jgi:hypothetical protein
MIYRVEQYRDDAGRRITRGVPITGDEKAGFVGDVTLIGKGVPPLPVAFDIPADTITEAYEKFDECAKAAVKVKTDELNAAIIRQTILTPDFAKGKSQ